MSFLIRYLMMSLITGVLLYCAAEKWEKYYAALMAGYFLTVGVLFLF